MSDDVEEVEIHLNQYDIDHLRDGAPVYKTLEVDRLLVLRPMVVSDDQ